MKCIVCNEEIEDINMSSALSLGSFPPATAKEVPVHIVCPHHNGWKFYGGQTKHNPRINMKIHTFPNGLTVKELKELIKDWPEVDEDDDPTGVWIETGNGMSSQVKEVWPLNKREHSADILFQTGRMFS